ncbi:MAG: hypothetical protein OFPI_06080 [Osedax symbiont Rs2]|nr:MAG: hypothetical protein OFPI_06080 [Osedax symbiont Rs2]
MVVRTKNKTFQIKTFLIKYLHAHNGSSALIVCTKNTVLKLKPF